MNKKKNTLKDPMHRPKKSAGRDSAQTAKPVVKNAEGLLAPGQAEQVESKHGPVQWKPWLDSYQDLRALQFRSREHFAAAAKLLWTGELRDLPYDLVGNQTVIVPAEAVAFFRGLELTETVVLHPSDMGHQELSELRMEQGPY